VYCQCDTIFFKVSNLRHAVILTLLAPMPSERCQSHVGVMAS